jgi:hypothetical protein
MSTSSSLKEVFRTETHLEVQCYVSSKPGVLHFLCEDIASRWCDLSIREYRWDARRFRNLAEIAVAATVYDSIAASQNLGTIDWSNLVVTTHEVVYSREISKIDISGDIVPRK